MESSVDIDGAVTVATDPDLTTVKIVARTTLGSRNRASGPLGDSMQRPSEAQVPAYAVIFDIVDVPSYRSSTEPGGQKLVVIVNVNPVRSVEARSHHSAVEQFSPQRARCQCRQ